MAIPSLSMSPLLASWKASSTFLPPSTSRAPAPPMLISHRRRPRRLVFAGPAAAEGARGTRRYKGTARREAALTEMIERKVAEAMDACEGPSQGSEGCRVAWDEVEEVSQAKGDADPLEPFCHHHPESDECVVLYDDVDNDDTSNSQLHDL
ncbi:calvin cycle protein CP12-3, chloroplastic [Canna indica]|uniref:Calvin cycle protein CP12-3, chloroplastic n=1 Tax=Canna indica TaxID=4628 RepID=A0AAQ3L6F0_9LILI|nr:calvin cycle protein CP12-3, chloroplastic [Canna indica]